MGHRDAAIGLHDLDEARIVSLALDVSLLRLAHPRCLFRRLGRFTWRGHRSLPPSLVWIFESYGFDAMFGTRLPRKERGDILFPQRRRIDVALHQRGAETFERGKLRRRFHPFHHTFQLHVPAEGEKGFHDFIAGRFFVQIRDEASVDLDLGQRQGMQPGEAGITGAEIVE